MERALAQTRFRRNMLLTIGGMALTAYIYRMSTYISRVALTTHDSLTHRVFLATPFLSILVLTTLSYPLCPSVARKSLELLTYYTTLCAWSNSQHFWPTHSLFPVSSSLQQCSD